MAANPGLMDGSPLGYGEGTAECWRNENDPSRSPQFQQKNHAIC
jgi:hypothetical protein